MWWVVGMLVVSVGLLVCFELVFNSVDFLVLW